MTPVEADRRCYINDVLTTVLNGLPIVSHQTDAADLRAKLVTARDRLDELIQLIEQL